MEWDWNSNFSLKRQMRPWNEYFFPSISYKSPSCKRENTKLVFLKQNCGWQAKNVYISSKSIQAKELWRLFISIIQFTPCKRGLKFVGNHSSIDARRRSLLYTTQITSFWKERTRNMHYLIKRRDYKHRNSIYSGTIKTKKL